MSGCRDVSGVVVILAGSYDVSSCGFGVKWLCCVDCFTCGGCEWFWYRRGSCVCNG